MLTRTVLRNAADGAGSLAHMRLRVRRTARDSRTLQHAAVHVEGVCRGQKRKKRDKERKHVIAHCSRRGMHSYIPIKMLGHYHPVALHTGGSSVLDKHARPVGVPPIGWGAIIARLIV